MASSSELGLVDPTSGHFREGKEVEILRYPNSSLFLLEYDDAQTTKKFRSGSFILKNVTLVGIPVFLITCTIDNRHWPLAKDMIVIRTGPCTFSFALPGILYGLQFHPEPSADNKEDTIESIARVFERYSLLYDLNVGEGYPFQEEDPEFWATVRPTIDDTVEKKFSQLGHRIGRSPFAKGLLAHTDFKAFRISIATNLLRQALLKGKLSPLDIEFDDKRPVLQQFTTGILSPLHKLNTYPSVTSISSIVESAEFEAWCPRSRRGKSPTWLQQDLPRLPSEKLGVRLWRINMMGLDYFMQIMVESDAEMMNRMIRESNSPSAEKGGESSTQQGGTSKGKEISRKKK